MALFGFPVSFSFGGRKARADNALPSHFVLELVKWQGATDARVENVEKQHTAFVAKVDDKLNEISSQLRDVLIRLGPPQK